MARSAPTEAKPPKKGKAPKAAEAPEATPPDGFAQRRARLVGIQKVAKDFKGWRPALSVLKRVEAVPTLFVDYDVAVKIGGHPIGRVTLIHGPAANGKTEFGLGLGLSFLRAGHFFGLLDAERTTPSDWVQSLYGEVAQEPGFVALQCDNTYEQATEAVRNFCRTIEAGRKAGTLDPSTTGLILVDSIRKLQPRDLMKKIAKEQAKDQPRNPRDKAPKGIDGAGGRAGQMKAALNAAWMDELVPLLADTRCSIAFIARETDDPDADFYDDEVKVGGGRALVFEASLRLRVQQRYLYEEDAAGKKHVIGEAHDVGIHKSKVAGRTGAVDYAVFHTSNGHTRPPGFWFERDLFATGKELGVIEQRGAYYFHDGSRIGQGEVGTLKRLEQDEPLRIAIEAAVRATVKRQEAST